MPKVSPLKDKKTPKNVLLQGLSTKQMYDPKLIGNSPALYKDPAQRQNQEPL